MSVDEREDDRRYTVVVNGEAQYSIWLVDQPLSLGWTEVGKSGSKAECLAYIQEVWTDMRPLSLRGNVPEPSPRRPRLESPGP